MARIVGSLRPNSTYGERELLAVLSGLPDDYTVWPELNLADADNSSIDFVIFNPFLGVCVVEAKDWVEITHANPDWFTIRMNNGRERPEKHPLKLVRHKAEGIADRLARKPSLVRSEGHRKGKLTVPWTYAVAFPNLTRMMVFWMDDVLNERFRICRDDLRPDLFEAKLRSLNWRADPHLSENQVADVEDAIFPEREPLTAAQQDAVRSAVDPDLIVPSPTGEELGVLDQVQEAAAKEDAFEVAQLEPIDADVAPEECEIAQRLVVRLVRGVAGSGKTRVLIARAKHLAKNHPDWRILAVTFNEPLARHLRHAFKGWEDHIRATHFHQICREGLEANDLWQEPVRDCEGRVAYILKNRLPDLQDQLTPRFLSEEIAWMKDTGCVDHEHYLATPRTGRGLPLQREDRLSVLRAFEAYEHHLQLRHCIDWGDVPLLALELVEEGSMPGNQYDAILVDEAQDFAPVWFEVLKRMINPATGVIFLAADATQRIYRRFTWKSLGLDVVGRSRVLSRSYRNTYEILHTAFDLVRRDDALLAQLADEGEELVQPSLDATKMRRGPYPELHRFENVAAERMYLVEWVNEQLRAGCAPGEIAILHRKNFGVERYLAALRAAKIPVVHLREEEEDVPQDQVIVSTIHLAKGLEYRSVYLGQLQEMFKPDKFLPSSDYSQFRTDELRLLYVGLARARERVCLTYERELPAEIAHLQEFLEQHRQSGG